MKDSNTKERNGVDLFSDYGLDERQKSMSASLGFEGFKALFTVTIILTGAWAAIGAAAPDGYEMPDFRMVFMSYFIAAIIVRCVYAAKAASNGLINGISAFSYTTGGVLRAVFFGVLGTVFIVLDKHFPMESTLLGVMLLIAAAEEVFYYFCGKKNFAVIDNDGEDEDEE